MLTNLLHNDLIHRLVSKGDDVLEVARVWAAELVELPAGSLAALKELLYAAAVLPAQEVAMLEETLFNEQWASPDHLEALAAFNEKRRPVFNLTQNH